MNYYMNYLNSLKLTSLIAAFKAAISASTLSRSGSSTVSVYLADSSVTAFPWCPLLLFKACSTSLRDAFVERSSINGADWLGDG